eukprot:NODE_979_length_2207_cov_45.214491_g836_i0.p1 GENE.NODE_979_length_2207_cov_45.214491_g836_i0~~NODE_979_length_2207_cov_45.214491_g836_i0.p1  ORF type:complete len:670 (+),score=125.23 NODE_979_length_2207_cov_45.214491_g836_i0:159-2168(+)
MSFLSDKRASTSPDTISEYDTFTFITLGSLLPLDVKDGNVLAAYYPDHTQTSPTANIKPILSHKTKFRDKLSLISSSHSNKQPLPDGLTLSQPIIPTSFPAPLKREQSSPTDPTSPSKLRMATSSTFPKRTLPPFQESLKRPKTVSSALSTASAPTRWTAAQLLIGMPPLVKPKDLKPPNPYATWYTELVTLRLEEQESLQRSNELALEGILQLAHPLCTIQCLNYWSCSLLPQVGQSLGDVLNHIQNRPKNSPLKVIILDDNPRLGEEGITPVLKSITPNNTITSLHLEHIGARDDIHQVLAEMLSNNKTLTHLNLAANGMTSQSLPSICEALAVNSVLLFLGLSYNKFGDDGSQYLSEALEKNSTLLEMELNGCRLTDAGACSIALAISNNQTLTSLGIMENTISDSGLEGIAEILQHNNTLLHIKFTEVSHTTSSRLKGISKRNQLRLQELQPALLEREVHRLYYQQHKLKLAQITLREHQKSSAEMEQSMQNQEIEFRNIKSDISKKSKDILNSINFQDLTITDLKSKRETLKNQLSKIDSERANAINTLTESLEEVTKRSKALEQELDSKNKDVERLNNERQARLTQLQNAIIQCRQDKQQYHRDRLAARDRIAEIQLMLPELDAQVRELNLSPDNPTKSNPRKRKNSKSKKREKDVNAETVKG